MIIDFKYHVVSLVAVFMALGIGIIIGSLLVGESFVTGIIDEQENIVQRLEMDYHALKSEVSLSRQEIDVLKKSNEEYKQYARQTLPQVIGGRLDQKRVAVVESGDAQAPANFLDNLRLSGAEIFLSNRSFNEASPVIESLWPEGPPDVLIFINCYPPDQLEKTIKQIQADVTRVLDERGTKVLNIVTGFEDNGKGLAEQDGVYYFSYGDCILQQVELILSLAEGSPPGQVKEASGF